MRQGPAPGADVRRVLAAALERTGSTEALARTLGAPAATVASWRQGRRSPIDGSLERLRAVAQGDDPARRERRIARMRANVAAGLTPWGEEPAPVRPLDDLVEEESDA